MYTNGIMYIYAYISFICNIYLCFYHTQFVGLVLLVSVLCIVGVSIQQCRYRRRQHRGGVAIDEDERTALLN